MSNFDFSGNAKGGETLSRVGDSAPLMKAGRTTSKAKKWTPQDIGALTAMYFDSPIKEIERALQRSRCSIVSKALALKLHRQTKLARKPWREEDMEILRRDYPGEDLEKISETLGRSVNALGIKAERMGLRRYKKPSADSMRRLRQVDPVIILLRDERRRQKLSQRKVSAKAGFHRNTISIWELGIQEPRISDLHAWAMALGRDITLAEKIIQLPPRDVLLKRWMGRR